MKIAKQYVSEVAERLVRTNELAAQAFHEVRSSMLNNVTPGSKHFILNCSNKNCNGVVPVKERCYQILEEEFGWYREKPLTYFHEDAQKGGPSRARDKSTEESVKFGRSCMGLFRSST